MTKLEFEIKKQSLGNDILEVNGKMLGAYEIITNLIDPNSPAGEKSKEYIAKGEEQYINLHNELDKLEKENGIFTKGQYE